LAAVVLVWNPNRWNGWEYHDVVEQVEKSGRFLQRWSLGHNQAVRTGTEVWLLLQGSSNAGTGLIGHGVVMSDPYEPAQSSNADITGWQATIAFDALLPLGEQIRPDALRVAVPEVRWSGAISCPAMSVPASAVPDLRQLWRDEGPTAVDPFQVVPGTCPPDATSSIDVNRFERNPDARRICLAFHGKSCAACGFSFESSYGDIGADFIQVHHVVPPAVLRNGYQLDPLTDLVPLCANCHAMAHHGVNTPRTVSELRTIISTSGHIRSEVVSESALEAQEDARRILEGPTSVQ
jgi:5-methylcytosine-specific restriction enzyme A